MKGELRNAHISILVFAIILVGGVFLFRNSGEEAIQLVGLVAFIAAFGLLFVLEDRAMGHPRRR